MYFKKEQKRRQKKCDETARSLYYFSSSPFIYSVNSVVFLPPTNYFPGLCFRKITNQLQIAQVMRVSCVAQVAEYIDSQGHKHQTLHRGICTGTHIYTHSQSYSRTHTHNTCCRQQLKSVRNETLVGERGDLWQIEI